MALNATERRLRDKWDAGYEALLQGIDDEFVVLQAQVTEMQARLAEVQANADGLFEPEDITLLQADLAPRRTNIQNWAAGL
jgi:hypothetical protein